MHAEALVLELAREAGFDLAGLAPLAPPADGPRFEAWLAAGHHADMDWLERQRERILDPARLLAGPDRAPGQSPAPPRRGAILTLGLGHARAAEERSDGARVARYALGRDYHNVIGKRLARLRSRLVAEGLLPADLHARAVVDAGPVLERSHAARAGLGFASKAANLLHPDLGPWFFLAELLLPVELEPTAPDPAGLGSCGTCSACLQACPTGAIRAPGIVDARRCISYQTIENRGSIPRDLRAAHGPWLFGCDVCSEVCPYGRPPDAEGGGRVPDLGERFGLHAAAEQGTVSWVEQGESAFDALTPGSPLRRARRAGMARNAAVVLGNVPSEQGRRALLRALSDDAVPAVREAAGWALARAHGDEPATRRALDAARAREPDPAVRSDLERDLDDL